jgi:hypothetical protein
MESDRIRQEAMDETGCDCMQLSTPKNSIHYHVEVSGKRSMLQLG